MCVPEEYRICAAGPKRQLKDNQGRPNTDRVSTCFEFCITEFATRNGTIAQAFPSDSSYWKTNLKIQVTSDLVPFEAILDYPNVHGKPKIGIFEPVSDINVPTAKPFSKHTTVVTSNTIIYSLQGVRLLTWGWFLPCAYSALPSSAVHKCRLTTLCPCKAVRICIYSFLPVWC
jgi:hypothetical protein